MKPSDVSVIDFFCGCGGSTTAAIKAGGRVTYAINHWTVAIESHNTNYPNVEHDCIDVTTVPSNRYPQATIGLFSPECGGHETASGKKRMVGQLDLFETEQQDIGRERSRMTMMEVCRFTEALNLEIAIVENVPEVVKWYLFDSWLGEMYKLGYEHQIVSFNSQFAWPIPQSRDRIYIIFSKRGNRRPDLEYRPLAYCPKCKHAVESYQWWKNLRLRVGRYQQQYLYRCSTCYEVVRPYATPAASVIDWSLDSPRIGDRTKLKKRPLKPATLRRIALGLQKFGNIPPFLVKYNGKSVASNLSCAMPTITTVDRCGLVQPPHHFLVQYYGREDATSSINFPIPTVTTEKRHALVHSAIEVEDCRFRMLTATEIKMAMGFDQQYVISGNKRDQVKQAGNAITPGAEEWQIRRCIESLS